MMNYWKKMKLTLTNHLSQLESCLLNGQNWNAFSNFATLEGQNHAELNTSGEAVQWQRKIGKSLELFINWFI